jgi:hypothetical protein
MSGERNFFRRQGRNAPPQFWQVVFFLASAILISSS